MNDRLRAVIVASYYTKQQQEPGKFQTSGTAPPASIHPTTKKYIGKAPVGTSQREENTKREENVTVLSAKTSVSLIGHFTLL